jgi:hypothetical protein
VIFARRSHVAIIFRRGPSKWVQLIKWNTDNDTFEPGQWFHGRIYEKRCDLSPDGSLLVYFAQKISARTLKEYTYAWTAISKPPYLTALALWPKGDCWNGGGLFHSNKALALYHTPATKPHPEHKPPRWLHVTFTDRGRREDDPIFSDRLERDGWKREQEWKVENHGHPKWYHTEQPEIRQKFNRNRKTAVQVIRAINRLDYTEEFFVLTDRRTCVAPIKQASSKPLCGDSVQSLLHPPSPPVFSGHRQLLEPPNVFGAKHMRACPGSRLRVTRITAVPT